MWNRQQTYTQTPKTAERKLFVYKADLAKDINSSAFVFEPLHDLLCRDTFWCFYLKGFSTP